jgi:recombination protein RecR
MEKITDLIDFVATLPGLGPRSAKRIFFAMMRDKKRMMYRFSDLLKISADTIVTCNECGSFDIINPCNICNNDRRDKTKLCVVTEVSDLWNVENSGHYEGFYYCLGGTMSTNQSSYQNINLDKLFHKINCNFDINEIIIATNATVENQTTAFFLIDNIKSLMEKNNRQIIITTLGQGMPIGSELDYLDEGTIGAAFRGRKEI